jgi:hypothetical protein
MGCKKQKEMKSIRKNKKILRKKLKNEMSWSDVFEIKELKELFKTLKKKLKYK